MKFSLVWTLVSLGALPNFAAAQSTCELALLGCPGGFAVDNCVAQYCKYGCSESCCGLSNINDIRTCLGQGSPNSNPTPTDPNYVACGTANRIISACSSLIPTFSAAPVSQSVTCLCYDANGTFDPTPFDNGMEGCASYFATANPTLVSVASEFLGFCTANNAAVTQTASPSGNQATPSLSASTTSPQTQSTVAASSAGAKSSQTGSASSIAAASESTIGMVLSFLFSLLYVF